MTTATIQNKEIQKIDTQDLKPGDIIATRTDAAGSRFIRVTTIGKVSHAILVVSNKNGIPFAVDATPGNGVTKDQLSIKLKKVSYAVAFRHKSATSEQCDKACQWAELQAQRHKPYDFKSAVGVSPAYGLTTASRLVVIADKVEEYVDPEGEDASFTCSELVFRAWEIAGVPLLDVPAHNLSPTMVLETNRLALLGQIV